MGEKKGSTKPAEAFGSQVWGCSLTLWEHGSQFMPPDFIGSPLTGIRSTEGRFKVVLIH
jgi:hypothetical protein